MSPRRAKAVRGRIGDDPATALREHLVDTAEALLAERPVNTLTTRDIARAAQVSDGVLYNYFADKNELLLAALIRRYARLLDRFATDLPEPGTGTVADNLLRYTRAMLDLMSQALPVAAGLFSHPPLLQGFIAAIHQPPFGPHQFQDPIFAYLRGEISLGRMAPVDPSAAVHLMNGATVTLALSVLIGGREPGHAASDLPAIVETLLRGLEPHG